MTNAEKIIFLEMRRDELGDVESINPKIDPSGLKTRATKKRKIWRMP